MKRMVRFSILEMLVVITIILIIMAMVMPVLQIVKEKANKAKTTAAAKSIGLIMVAYAEDDLRAFRLNCIVATIFLKSLILAFPFFFNDYDKH